MTVIKEQNGKWSVRCWYRNWRGERKQKTKRGFEKQKDAKAWERDFLSQEHGQVIKMDALISAFEKKLDTLQHIGSLKASTVENKKKFIERYIKEFFTGANVDNITPQVINDWLAYISKKHGRNGKMSTGTLRVTRNMLSQIFAYGIKHLGLISNPVDQSDRPAAYSNDERAELWTVEEFNIFYAALTKEINKVMFNTLYWSGLRIGELLALTPADIHDGVITVNKTWVQPAQGPGYASTPKTPTSYRDVVVPEFIFKQLQEYISSIDGLRSTDRIFPVTQSSASHLMAYQCRKLGLPKASLHTLRHSYASNLLAQSKDFVAAASQLGHANPNTTFKVYAHVLKKSAEDSVQKLSDLHKK